MQRVVEYLGVAFDEEHLLQLWEMGEAILPELERRAKEEKLNKSGQRRLFETVPAEYEREVPEGRTADIRKMTREEDVLDGPFDVWGAVFDKMGLEDILGISDRGRGATNALKSCLIAKLAEGGSKLRAANWLKENFGVSLSEDRIYRMMDKLAKKIDKVKEMGMRHGRALCGDKISLMLFDVTTLYFESFAGGETLLDERAGNLHIGLRAHGYSKDCKFKETQVVLALATSAKGIPLWYDLFPGNTAECSTLRSLADKLRDRVNPDETWIVADNAMLTQENRGLLHEANLGYVLGASVRKLPGPKRCEALDLTAYAPLGDTRSYRTLPLDNGNTMIITHSGKKAKKDAHDRETLVKRALKKLNKKGKAKAGRLIGNRGTSRFLEKDGEGETAYRLSLSRIEEDARYDGLHAIETDREIACLDDVHAALAAYGSLWHIEDCFRVSKSDIRVRPIYHWTSERIHAHVAICFLALLMERYLEHQLAVRRHVTLSAKEIKNALLHVNSTLIRDKASGALYRFPSPMSNKARDIYAAMSLKRGKDTTEITSLANYRRRVTSLSPEAPEELTDPE